MELQLRQIDKLEEENKELKTVLRRLCHEMGNALTLLGGSIFYLEHELKHKASDLKLQNLKGDYAYICKLFANLRDYNHTEAEEKDNIKLIQLVDNIDNIFDKLNTDKTTKLYIEKTIDMDNLEIYADITKIRQAIINIVKNSLEAMEENSESKGKKIIVKINKEEVIFNKIKQLDENINENKNMDKKMAVHIEIKDNGKGISEEKMVDIFKPLHTFGKRHGCGLGLAVVKKIVEDHHGKIKAVSALGTGTAMHIYLPLL